MRFASLKSNGAAFILSPRALAGILSICALVGCGGRDTPYTTGTRLAQDAQTHRALGASTGSAVAQLQVSQLYVALFGRAPDTEGLNYWVGRLQAGESVSTLADAMYAVQPARQYYPAGLSPRDVVGSFYRNVLGRDADTGGLDYWTAKLNIKGATEGSVIAEMIAVVVNYNGTVAEGIKSSNFFNNRANAALYYAQTVGMLGINTSQAIISVTDDRSTVSAASKLIDAMARIDRDSRELSVVWEQTPNSVRITQEQLGYFVGRGGFGAFDLYGNKLKSFVMPSGREFWVPRLPSDEDFLTFSFNEKGEIFIDRNPVSPKYVAGVVTNILTGNFGAGPNSLIMIDQGRETKTWPNPPNEYSYLWRLDKINGEWQLSEFAKGLGKQFWHSSSNPLDINGDGVLDFSVANLASGDPSSVSNPKLRTVLFVSSGKGDYVAVDHSNYLCRDSGDTLINYGGSALIKLANGGFASIGVPYLASQWEKARYGTILYLDSTGQKVISTKCFDVRLTALTADIKDGEGYNSVKVADINGDGLDDFIILAEGLGGQKPEGFKRVLVFIQNMDSSFRVANDELGLPFTYTLPNADPDKWQDWTGNEFIVTDINGDKLPDLFMFTQLIKHDSIMKYGLRGGVVSGGGRFLNHSIPSSKIVWNNERAAYSYRYIYPADLNGDGIVDFILIGAFYDSALVSPTNEFGAYFRVSALLSKVNSP
jgi:Domain of unknown function (DUF4214)